MKIEYDPENHYGVFLAVNICGEWEYIKSDGSCSRFHAGSTRYKIDKKFKTEKAARKYADKTGIEKYKLVFNSFPQKGSCQYGVKEIIVNEIL